MARIIFQPFRTCPVHVNLHHGLAEPPFVTGYGSNAQSKVVILVMPRCGTSSHRSLGRLGIHVFLPSISTIGVQADTS